MYTKQCHQSLESKILTYFPVSGPSGLSVTFVEYQLWGNRAEKLAGNKEAISEKYRQLIISPSLLPRPISRDLEKKYSGVFWAVGASAMFPIGDSLSSPIFTTYKSHKVWVMFLCWIAAIFSFPCRSCSFLLPFLCLTCPCSLSSHLESSYSGFKAQCKHCFLWKAFPDPQTD